MGIENVVALLVVIGAIAFAGYRQLRRRGDRDIERDLADYESIGTPAARAAKDPFQAVADQSNYRNYR
jgi:hypothetical protein